jgi:hypothetical protein
MRIVRVLGLSWLALRLGSGAIAQNQASVDGTIFAVWDDLKALLFEFTNPNHALGPGVGDRATLTIAPQAITYGNVVPDDLPVLEAARQRVPVG